MCQSDRRNGTAPPTSQMIFRFAAMVIEENLATINSPDQDCGCGCQQEGKIGRGKDVKYIVLVNCNKQAQYIGNGSYHRSDIFDLLKTAQNARQPRINW